MKKALFITDQRGFSLAEIIVASAVFALLVTAFTGTLLYLQSSAKAAGARAQAGFLAQEGLGAVRNIRDDDFANLSDGTYGLDNSGGSWQMSGGSDTTGDFTRQVTISSINDNTKEVRCEVSWNQSLSSTELVTRLTNWQEIVQVADSCASVCQISGYSDGTCRRTSRQCSRSGEVYQSDGDMYCRRGWRIDACCCAP